MRFSLGLPFPSGESDAQEYGDYVDFAQAAERAGLDAVSTTDHPFPVVAGGRAGHHTLDPFVLQSLIGGATESIALHFSLIVAPYRNPFLLARQISSLDILTRGRCIVALGAGYLAPEFAALGASYDRRATAVEGTLEAMELAWSGEPVVAAGHGWSADGNVMRPRPYSRPRPRMWRGGNSGKALRSAVEHFDGWSPFEVNTDWSQETSTAAMNVETLPKRLERVRTLVDESGRTTPFETCFVRTTTRWLADRSQAVDELGALQDAGLDWLEFKLYGRTHQARLESIDAFAELVRSNNLQA
ncbi:MAG: TIGR03619 family F420-dependent LLM class oxidoreductase [Actinomycetia bacterium]|nr:TIGR03619 family F420-dependent LLM class oxidoreductase [Actinomycetes bacterium]